MKMKDMLKSKQPAIGSRPYTDIWVLVELNERWDILKHEFVMWYYFMMNIPDDSKTATDGFCNYLLEYFRERYCQEDRQLGCQKSCEHNGTSEETCTSSDARIFVDRGKIEEEA